MSISGSMYAGISGLTSQAQAMSVIGNNLSNSSTLGFKSATTQFEDVFYSSVNTANGISQVGHGTTVASIYNDFSQGSYESSSSSTAMAIGGNGFFILENPNTDGTYYTRAGDFQFDADGYLVAPNGYQVQGWDVDSTATGTSVQTTGAIGDLQLDSYQSPPQATTEVMFSGNLDRDATDNTTSATDPYFALATAWDGTASDPIASDAYEYQTTMSVYDEAGSEQELTIYFDPVGTAVNGEQTWEYIVTVSPSADGRTIDGVTLNTDEAGGLLMTGTMTFNASGQLTDQSAFTLASTADSTLAGGLSDLDNWTPAEFDSDGYPVFVANFAGSANASASDEADAVEISLDFGLRNNDATPSWSGGVANAGAVGTTVGNLPSFSSSVLDADAVTSTADSSSTLDQSQNGYGTGYLQNIEVDSDGVITGRYSNGQITDLFVVALADFDNMQGLNLEGGNMYTEGTDSGTARTGRANTARFGSIQPNTLEQSNVDMSTEMVRLITTQRGYQANSKTITTADSMLQEAINLKR